MPLIRFDNVHLAFGHRALLDGIDLEIHGRERVCLVGRNGEGKSSLLKLIDGKIEADDGDTWRRPGIRIGKLDQEIEAGLTGTVFDVVAAGLPRLGQLVSEYLATADQVSKSPDAALNRRLSDLQHELEAADGWQIRQKVETVISRLGLNGQSTMDTRSGGWRRRVMLARALVSEPDLLLLDEPTNHLDIDAINWLEDFMLGFQGALMFITHDRALARRVATRVIDLDRGALSSWTGSYDQYLKGRELQLDAEQKANAAFDKKLAQEEAWIRQGIKARRTRNEGRVRALQTMREERQQRREQSGKVNLRLDEGEQSGRLVFDAIKVGFSYHELTIVNDLSLRVMRGDRVGIIGPNGSGKSTLIKLLLGELKPDKGKIKRGTQVETAYFDQNRDELLPEETVMNNVADGAQYVTINGKRRHVAGYLRSFLFPPARFQSPVTTLSGGEKNRLMLAKRFAQPANLLVLDEPTNDLDVETLELLEDLIADYAGTLIIVSHDRAFLDNVVTSVLVCNGDGQIEEHVGGYSEWLAYSKSQAATRIAPARGKNAGQNSKSLKSAGAPRKLGYREQQEYDALPDKIDALETEQKNLERTVSEPSFYERNHEEVAQTLRKLESITGELDECYERWNELDAIRDSADVAKQSANQDDVQTNHDKT